MKPLLFIVACIALVSLTCGTNYEKEGEDAFNNKDYTTAINNYKQALPNSLNKEAVREKLALSFFYRGVDLFDKTRNLKAFVGNFEQGETYLPQFPDEEFLKEYSRMMYEMAKAYSVSKPKNEIEEDEYYKNSLELLNEAVFIDSTNQAAADLIVQIQQDSFKKLLATAQKFYDRANRTGQVDLFLSSEYYVKQAAQYNPNDKDVINLFRKIKKKTLAVLNYRDGVSIAVANYGGDKDGMVMNLTIKNYLSKAVELDLSRLLLVARDGMRYGIDEDAMRVRDLFGEKMLESTSLAANNGFAEGKVVFDATSDTKVAYLVIKYGRRQESRKYFP